MLIWRCTSVRLAPLQPTHESGVRVYARVCVFSGPILGNTADGSQPHVSPWRAFTQDWWVRFYSSLSSLLPICSLSPPFLSSNRHCEHSSGEIDLIKGWIRIFSNLPWVFMSYTLFLKGKVFHFSFVRITPNGIHRKNSLCLRFCLCHNIIFALYYL